MQIKAILPIIEITNKDTTIPNIIHIYFFTHLFTYFFTFKRYNTLKKTRTQPYGIKLSFYFAEF